MATKSVNLPVVLNMVVCDAAHRDPSTGKWTLLGLFNSINSSAFPMVHAQLIVYVALTNAEGKVPLRFQIVASDRREEVLYKVEAELTVAEPHPVVDLGIAARNINFARPGQYLLQLFTQHHFLTERPINIVKT